MHARPHPQSGVAVYPRRAPHLPEHAEASVLISTYLVPFNTVYRVVISGGMHVTLGHKAGCSQSYTEQARQLQKQSQAVPEVTSESSSVRLPAQLRD